MDSCGADVLAGQAAPRSLHHQARSPLVGITWHNPAPGRTAVES